MRAVFLPRTALRLRALPLGVALLLAVVLLGGATSIATAAAGIGLGAPATGLANPPADARVPDATSTGGRKYDVTITSKDSGAPIVFTVFEPSVMTKDERYPLILHGHGFGGSRSKTITGPVPSPEGSSPGSVLGDVQHLVNNGFWVVSFDQRGHNDSGGSVRFMDPDHEGKDMVQMLDWLEAHLNRLAYRKDNLVLGATGGSYGGGYQYLLLAVDPKRRLDAIVPQITWHDLNKSFAPNGVLQSSYILALMGPAVAGTQGRIDPYLIREMIGAGIKNKVGPDLEKFLTYHSPAYWCDGRSFTGTTDEGKPYRPATPFPKIDALVVHGMQDAIFSLNEDLSNVSCLKKGGGDVRLTTYQFGHAFPNGINIASPPPLGPGCSLADLCPDGVPAIPTSLDGVIDAGFSCGGAQLPALELTWMKAKLARDPAAIRRLKGVGKRCLSLDSLGDSVLLDGVARTTRTAVLPKGSVVLNGVQPKATAIPLLDIEKRTVLAGASEATITIDPVLPDAGLRIPELGVDDPIIFVGLARSRGSVANVCNHSLPELTDLCDAAAPVPGILPADLEVIDGQLTPIRGLGTHTLDLNGIGERLGAGEQLQLLVYSAVPQHALTGSRTPFIPAVTVSGQVKLPILGDLPRVKPSALRGRG